ncbi:serine hydrolase domain-containing protein [Streptomyces marianii]|uniref:Serine hydrolase n=1 Tax=Streptomyces marianii TaxID=1817406 RepID=A0A5R9E2L8_9ACTN|nr:serine hydrolase domain-containing protein [Streptomyces marianii]TLQ42584.1 serine hydrolase [Streptomyces marianii]
MPAYEGGEAVPRRETDALLRHVEAERSRHGIPGLALAIVDGTGVLHAQGFGRTGAQDEAEDVSAATLFRLGSVTKPLTATTVLRLHDRGVMDLDRPVVDVLPALADCGYPAVDRITARMLLGHTAGLPHDFFPTGRGDPADLPEMVLRLLRTYEPVAPPGTAYSYSNPGYDLAGAMAETAAGTPFPQLVDELVLRPLGMASTTFDPVVAITHPFAFGHRYGADGTLVTEGQVADNVAHYPSGFALSNVLDMGRFVAAHLGAVTVNTDRLLTEESQRLMRTAHARLFLPDDTESTLGFHRWRWQGHPVLGHVGDICGYGAWLAMLPDRRIGAVLLANAIPPGFDGKSLVHRILVACAPGPARPDPGTATRPGSEEQPADAYPRGNAGVFVGQATGLVRLAEEADGLTAEINGRHLRLRPAGNGRFEGGGPGDEPLVSLGFPGTGPGCANYVMVDGELCKRFDESLLATPDPADLARYTGTYARLDEVTVFVRDGQLHLYSQEDLREFRCLPLTRTMFAFEGGVIDFMVDETGKARAIRARNAVTLHRTGPQPCADSTEGVRR